MTPVNQGHRRRRRVKAKGIHNTFNKTMAEISQISRKNCLFRYRKPPEHQTGLTKIKPPHGILSLKQKAQKEY
jgi:hypothetical protein